MRTNTVKEKLARGECAYGTMVFEFNTTGIGRIVGEAGRSSSFTTWNTPAGASRRSAC